MKDFAGKCAVITGGGNGLGSGMAIALAERGMNIVIADRDDQGAEKTAAEVRNFGVEALTVKVDVADPAAVEQLAATAYERFGSVQLLMNNAAVWERGALADMSSADWQWMSSVNLAGPANGIRAFVPRMLRQDGERHISITSSTNGLWMLPGQGAYNTIKYALIGMAEALELELREQGISVSVICPGPMATEMARLSRPPSLGGDSSASQLTEVPPELAEMFASWGMQSPAEAGRNAVRGLADGEFYILTHAQGWPEIEPRFERLREAFRRRGTW
jgi:NAD(P)-dependent dehydrogenase (short-subunit alcohol dehydrogenase family)